MSGEPPFCTEPYTFGVFNSPIAILTLCVVILGSMSDSVNFGLARSALSTGSIFFFLFFNIRLRVSSVLFCYLPVSNEYISVETMFYTNKGK